jgi:hypothetical protein
MSNELRIEFVVYPVALAWYASAMRKILAIATLSLCGCVHQPTDAETCAGYGFEPSTPAWSQCLQTESVARRQHHAAVGAMLSNMANSMPTPTFTPTYISRY